MTPRHHVATVLASSLLGVIAVASIITGAFMFFGAWVIEIDTIGRIPDVGTGAAIFIGTLAVAFGVVAALAARDVWEARARGQVLGLITGLVTVLAAASALMVGDVDSARPLLLSAVAVGLLASIAVVADAVRLGSGSEEPRHA